MHLYLLPDPLDVQDQGMPKRLGVNLGMLSLAGTAAVEA